MRAPGSMRCPTRRGVALRLAAAGLALLGLAGEPALAEECCEAGRRISFRVERSREVVNDRVVVVVGVTAEDADAAKLADSVNRDMAWALEQARAAKGVDVESGGYRTSPVYEDGRLRRWRASQDLVLESGDTDAATALVGTLQSRLQLRSFSFDVSREKRREVEDGLISEALAAFLARAELVRESLGAGGFEIDQLSIDTAGRPPDAVAMLRQAEFVRSSSKVAPPAVEGGTSRLSSMVHGTIVLE